MPEVAINPLQMGRINWVYHIHCIVQLETVRARYQLDPVGNLCCNLDMMGLCTESYRLD